MNELLMFVLSDPWLFFPALGLLAVLGLFAIATFAVHWSDWGRSGSFQVTFWKNTVGHKKTSD
ncbi:hypothetical protein FF011L_01500 [Roseimaritima multifibrata]|uniref:Uncharacterized protein n=1 Tax=Roseimaritima multifibrata TaxID=1930274 RepID=A0A517M949_9BACT|nr:hypothetical protein [Roseimaritima multifibrata]QDS91420.1 hypothetical protein FF011L_01500 [Roseimaritima multifibrata]